MPFPVRAMLSQWPGRVATGRFTVREMPAERAFADREEAFPSLKGLRPEEAARALMA